MKKKEEPGSFEVIGGLVFVIALFWIVPMFCDGGDTPTQNNNPPEWYRPEAFKVAETFVKRELKSPGSAKFPTSSSIRRESVTVLGDGVTYRITSWVDSQNTFGELVRTVFTCTIKRIDRPNDFPEWELVNLEFVE